MQVTLTAKFTNYKLLALLQALTGNSAQRGSCRYISIQNDLANGGAHIYKGTSLMTNNGGVGPAANYDVDIISTLKWEENSERQDIDITDIVLQSDKDGAVVNVAIANR